MPPPAPTWFRLIQGAYLVTCMAALVVMTLYMTSGEFRYWCFKQQKELQYQLAVIRYRMRAEPLPQWALDLRQDSELPQEQAPPEA